MKNRIFILSVFLIWAGFLSGCSDQKSGSKSYVEELGNDTLSVENFVRNNMGYHGKLMQRIPATQVATYQTELNNDGMVSHMSIQWKTPSDNPNGPKSRAWEVTLKDTMATIHMTGVWRGKNVDTTFSMKVPAGTIPAVGKYPPAVSTYAQVLSQAEKNGGHADYSTSVLVAGWNRLIPTQLHHLSGDTVAMKEMYGVNYLATTNGRGQINWYSAKNSTVKTITRLEPSDNLENLAMAFAKRDEEGKGMPVASPLDSAKVTVGNAHLKIVYSRPSVRGRTIWGGLVPWNKVWRTGANAATMFYTDKNLEIGKTKVPAGMYTLYSIYTPDSAKLIINNQTGQWGTVYHEDRDFARIPMEKEEITSPQEKFLISFEKVDNGGFMLLSWNKTRYKVSFKVE